MAAPQHVYEVFIRATPEQVWQAITDPDFTARYFHQSRLESTLTPGSPYRYVLPDEREAIVGEVEEVEPPHRLVMSCRFVFGAALAAEPSSRIEWRVAPVGATDGDAVTRLTLRHLDLGRSPLTWATVRLGWVPVLDGLKTLLETGAPLGDVVDDEVGAVPDDPDGEWHRAEGIEANNGTWAWLERTERTAEDDEAMTASAYASAYHWARAARRAPENGARADWLLSRVWAVRGEGSLALHYADRVLRQCEEHGLEDFDLAYGHEARARALACLGRLDEAGAELDAARAVPIADPEDRDIVVADLAAEPWFGLVPA